MLCSALKWTVSSTQLDIHAFTFTSRKKGSGVLGDFTGPCKEDQRQFGRNVVNVRDILVISLGNLIQGYKGNLLGKPASFRHYEVYNDMPTEDFRKHLIKVLV